MKQLTKNIILAIAFIAIILLAACAPMDKTAMKRESGPAAAPVAEVAQAQPVRVILIGPGW